MTSRDFCYWLQGMLELSGATELDARQTDLVRRHLNMVFVHEIDPSFPKDQQAALQAAHDGKPPEKPQEVHVHHHHGHPGDKLIRC